jgi:N-sulfoglucosamine sulfohydrolase
MSFAWRAYLHRPPEELYDIVNDSQQLVNLADLEQHRDTLLQLRAELGNWRADTKDPWLAGQTSPFEQH